MEILPRSIYADADLEVSLSPRGRFVFKALGPAEGVALTPEQATSLAFDLLGVTCPWALDAIEREIQGPRLRLIEGGADGGSAA